MPTKTQAASLGASSASAGSALPPSVATPQSFQPDLFTGRATTTIPILVPPGRRGIQPAIAPTYTSTGRNGWLGVGWSLDLGSIERSTLHGVPQYTVFDTFVLTFQGVSSELTTIVDGTYRMKDEGAFLRIVNQGSAGWEVRDTSGTRYLFGGSTDSEVRAPNGNVFSWRLRKVIDIHDNSMSINYFQDQGQTYPQTITYTAHESSGLAPIHTITFVLKPRTDIETSYRSGFPITTAQLLSEIQVKTQGNWVRRYVFWHGTSTRTNRSLLTSVTQYGSDNQTTLPPTTFSYQQTPPAFSMTSNTKRLGTPGWNVRSATLDTGHDNFGCIHPYASLPWGASAQIAAGGSRQTACGYVNVRLDGSISFNDCQDHFTHAWTHIYVASSRTINLNYTGSEACAYVEDQTGVRQADPSSVTLNSGWSILHITGYHQHESYINTLSASLAALVDTMNPTRFIAPQISGDFNGDGFSDIALLNPTAQTISVALGTGSGFTPESLWLSNYGGNSVVPVVGDFDGDGKADLCLFNTANATWDVSRSTGSGFSAPTRWLTMSGEGFGREPIIGDFNGDSELDVGYVDPTNGNARIALSDGTKFLSPITWATGLGGNKTYFTGDFNGDGLTDMASYAPATGTWQVAFSNGSGFVEASQWRTNFGTTTPTGTNELVVLPSALARRVAFYGSTQGSSYDPMLASDPNGHTLVLHFDGGSLTWGSVGIDFNETLTNLDAQIDFSSSLQLVVRAAGAVGGEKMVAHIRDAAWQGSWNFNTVQARTPPFPSASLTTSMQDISFNLSGLILNHPIDLSQVVHLAIEAGAPASLNFEPGNPPNTTIYINQIKLIFNRPLGRQALAMDCNDDGITDAAFLDRLSGQVSCANAGQNAFGNEYILAGTFGQRNEDVQLQVGDFNGDGLLDPAIFNAATGNSQIAASSAATPDLLSRIVNPLGGFTDITYASSSVFGSTNPNVRPQLPFPVAVVSQVTSHDGYYLPRPNRQYTTQYRYFDGKYDGPSREFRGFGTVQVIDGIGTVTETQFAQDADAKGRPLHVTVKDQAGNLFSKTDNVWNCTHPSSDITYCRLTQTDHFIYDGNASFKQSRTRLAYDDYGNVSRTDEDGDVSLSGDERSTVTERVYNTTDWIVNRPSRIYSLAPDGSTVTAQRRFYYDNYAAITDTPTKGDLTKEEAWLNTNPEQWFGTTTAYDTFGNAITVTDALNNPTTTQYDTVSQTYPTRMTNALNQFRLFAYDLAFGQVTQATDLNNQTTITQYDVFGRMSKVIGPNDTAALPTLEYQYDFNAFGVGSGMMNTVKARLRSGFPEVIKTSMILDGLGRVVQNRAPAEDPTKEVITGEIEYDPRGLVVKQWLPYLDNVLDNPNEHPYIKTPPIGLVFASYVYDAVGRTLQAIEPNNATTTTVYDDWSTTVTDANNHATTRFSDAFGRLTEVREVNGAATYKTRYEYDTLNNLKKVTDALGHITTINYDSLSRKTGMDDPDMGHWAYTYDAVGNLKTQTDARGVITTFGYDALNRIKTKTYAVPGGVVNLGNVTYTYDEAVRTFPKGKLTSITDGSGSSAFDYDNLGRLTKETKIIGGNTYVIQRAYDLLGRLTSLTYPDNEVVSYTYNAQGGIETVSDVKSGITTTYVSDVNYNADGQITHLAYGNGVTSDYTFNPQTLRLDQLVTTGPGGSLQNLTYTFDPVGNVKQIQDTVHTDGQQFNYDDLNRLTQAIGSYGTLGYSYDAVGNMTNKEGVTMNYGLADGSKPHAITSTTGGLTLSYDANGNLITKAASSGTTQSLKYDAEGRVSQVTNSTDTTPPLTVTLASGWNLISFPRLAAPISLSIALAALGGNIRQISRLNGTTQKYESAVGNSGVDQFSNADPHRGYWVYVTNPAGTTLTFTGAPSASSPQSLAAGTHLLAGPYQTMPVASWLSGLVSGTDYGTVMQYDAASKTFSTTTSVSPGKAYRVQILRSVTWNPPTPPTAPSTATSFVYDGDGGRVKATTAAGTTAFLGQNVEIAPDGTTTKSIFVGSQRIVTKTSTGVLRFYHGDHLGSSNVITDGAGALVELDEYTPYGSLAKHTGTADVPQKFTGQRLDASTSLYFYNARYYDPQLGRFISADPVVPSAGDPQALNRYSYVRNNPLKYTDPSGHFAFLAALFVLIKIALVGAAVGAATGALFGGIGAALHGGSFWTGTSTGFLGGAVYGATAFTGSAIAAVIAPAFAASFFGQLAIATAAGVLSGGVTGKLSGGSFGRSALQGGLTSAVTFGAARSIALSPIGKALADSSIGQATDRALQPINRLFGNLTTDLNMFVNAPNLSTGNPNGIKVYRMWGRQPDGTGSGPTGRSWTTINPRTQPDFRAAAGLPRENAGRFVSEGILQDTENVTVRPALPGYTTRPETTRIPEIIVHQPEIQVDIDNVYGVNPDQ